MKNHETAHIDGEGAAFRSSRTFARRLFWTNVVLIAYGSLYPFRLAVPASTIAAWQAFISDHSLWTSGGDVVGNVVLCVPLGICALAMPAGASFRRAQLAAVFLLCVAFVFAIQVVQIFFPPREAALSDAFWNTVGIAIGMALGSVLRRLVWSPDTQVARDAWPALALLAAWLLTQLAPFVPSLDWQLIKDSIKPLVVDPHIDPVHLAYTAARVLAAGCLFAAVAAGSTARAALGLGALLAGILAAKFFIAGQGLTPDNVLGFAAGYATWLLLQGVAPRSRHMAALAILFLAYTLAGLAPFELRANPNAMNLLPFAALLEGAMEVNAWALVEALYVFGAILWLVQRVGGAPMGSAVALAIWVGMIETAQMWLEGRTSDITQPLLALGAGYLMYAWRYRSARASDRDSGSRSSRSTGEGRAMPASKGCTREPAAPTTRRT